MTAPAAPRRRGPVRLRLDPATMEDAQQRWTLRRWFTVGATVLGVLSVLAVVLGAWAVVRIADARTVLYDEVAPAVTASQNLSSAVRDQETGVRGFTILANDVFLAPYVNGKQAEAAAVAALQPLDRSFPGARLPANLQEVEVAADTWRRDYAEPTIAAARAGAPTPNAEEGRLLFDRVRVATATLIDDLQTERLAARQRLDSTITFLAVVGITITAVAAVFLLLASIGLRKVILSPIRRLAAQTRQVVEGSVGTRVLGSGPRELVELGADVEAMRSHIQREVDELQEANAQLDDRTRDLERSNRDLEQFAYVASHDLQEPLRKVSSFCQLLQRRYGGKLDERADQYIEFAVDGAQRMQRLINDLLAFSRVGRTTTGFEPVDLGKAAGAAAAQLAAQVEETGGEIAIADGLPTVPGDPSLVQQLLMNLIGNGLKFHRTDVPPVVRVDAVQRGDEWEVSVSDNGIGIEPEFADKIFVIFQRLHGRDVYAGTGIGLALAKKIVEFHGGRIWVDHGEPDEPGTAIRLTLPVSPADPPPADPALAGAVPSKESPS
ncbi:ATP-binding protein [Pseudonocardia halophobica]|uniref:histidine kinase n=2 Tax=Pseudonocardia halophobica TaxID=29401 RepID=A0A9W6L0I3_9PSEU|nr:sensor histidine kinase [Pseudonocardia halophobica]GLL11507.1 histidine kinase [Pseudonocardia halophobica]